MTKRHALNLIFICILALLPAMALGAVKDEAVSNGKRPAQTALLDNPLEADEEPLLLLDHGITLVDADIADITDEYAYELFAAMEDAYAIKTVPIPVNELSGLCEWNVTLYPSDIPLIVNKNVHSFIRYFQTRGKKVFTKWLERTPAYMPMISGILEEAGLPLDLIYLALIESGLNPYAYSRARAAGMWQFIPGTAKIYGLRVDWWIDERRDPEKATLAAATYLSALNSMFDSWYLAAAGYNAGEGKIKRAIKTHKTSDFWEIASYKNPLKRETKEYVPKLIAAILIAKDPARYGFTGMNYNEPVLYEKVTVPSPTDINIIAAAAQVDAEKIKSLNPELKRWFTPPDYKNYEIKVPLGKGELVREKLESMPKQELVKFLIHKVKRGETLSQIARRYGTELKPLMYLNDIKNVRRLKPGDQIAVPIRAVSFNRTIKNSVNAISKAGNAKKRLLN